MEDGYKNREVVNQRCGNTINYLSESERNEYLRDGNITISAEPHFERKIEERFTSRKEVGKYGLEELLKSSFYCSELATDGVPITYFLNIYYGLISVIKFSDKTIHVYCNNHKFFPYLTEHLKNLEYEYESFTDFIRINLNKIQNEENNNSNSDRRSK